MDLERETSEHCLHNEMDVKEESVLLGAVNVEKRDTLGGNVLETHKFVKEI